MVQIPYVNIGSGNNSGIIPKILENLVTSCCKTCKAHGTSIIDYLNSLNKTDGGNMDEKSLKLGISHLSDLTFPIHGYMDQDIYKTDYIFTPMVASPGVTFIAYFSSQEADDSKVLSALFRCWPLLAFLLLLIWLAGIIIWFLVRRASFLMIKRVVAHKVK
jgi:hypothetical protein